MPILDEITQPDPAGMGEVLNRNNHHTLDAKDHDGSCRIWVNRVGLTMRRALPVFLHKQTRRAATGMSQPTADVIKEAANCGGLTFSKAASGLC